MGLTDLLADLGAVIVKYLSDSAVAFVLVILALMFHWIAALLVILMVAYVYKSGGARKGEIPAPKAETNSENLIIVIGAVMVTAGGYWLIQELFGQKIPASVGLILVGILLIVLGYAVKGERSV
ncbi:MAG: hypothetical protein DRN90_08160 [Thermoproteota archaeon]|nr:MAG: hypothetical protein DRN90_08160 [Candidatus Korarchaeota archaeon]